MSAPVLGDVTEEAVLDLVPLRGAWREVRDADGEASPIVQAKHFGRDEVAAAATWLKGRLGDEPGAILVKGSRGLKLERFLGALAVQVQT
jgi:SH3-like domain-containing protein